LVFRIHTLKRCPRFRWLQKTIRLGADLCKRGQVG
jgi:hypothetical protein